VLNALPLPRAPPRREAPRLTLKVFMPEKKYEGFFKKFERKAWLAARPLRGLTARGGLSFKFFEKTFIFKIKNSSSRLIYYAKRWIVWVYV